MLYFFILLSRGDDEFIYVTKEHLQRGDEMSNKTPETKSPSLWATHGIMTDDHRRRISEGGRRSWEARKAARRAAGIRTEAEVLAEMRASRKPGAL
jgi:hypothetical protein